MMWITRSGQAASPNARLIASGASAAPNANARRSIMRFLRFYCWELTQRQVTMLAEVCEFVQNCEISFPHSAGRAQPRETARALECLHDGSSCLVDRGSHPLFRAVALHLLSLHPDLARRL